MNNFSRHRLTRCVALGVVVAVLAACGARETPAAAPAPGPAPVAAAAAAAATPSVPAAVPSTATPAAAVVAATTTTLDPDFGDFVARRKQCDHFRGEEGNTPKRKAELSAKLKEFCAGSDAQLAALKAKYRDNSEASKTLAAFDANIE
jgi:hypothetical protein